MHPGDVIVLICSGPMGSGMEATYQIASALKYLDFGKHVAVLTDARFSGISTGACIGHISPEALAGRSIGKVLDGDVIEIVVDRVNLEGAVNLVGHGADLFGAAKGERVGRAAYAAGLGAGLRAARGDAAMGGSAAGERRYVGRVCV